uniref:No apical meristem-associated C-terminal domain-containing protein n=1 Tax=Tanacetum cinerariifolium TaxID=118510 RepID=A0A6L2P6R7_TANCI|nr:hypothetical protein [Tanacetum cinerariifolium]
MDEFEDENEDEAVPTPTSRKTKGGHLKKMAKKNKEKETQVETKRARNLWSQGEKLLLAKKTLVMSGENDEDWMTRVEILFKTHTGVDFKHKSVWLFLKDKQKWKNPKSTLSRRNHLHVTDEEPEHFGKDALPRPPGAQRIAKSQRSSKSTASFGLNRAMFQEMIAQEYELDCKAKMNVNEREANSRINLYNSQRIFEDMRVLQIDTRGMDLDDATIINAQKARAQVLYQPQN